ncbi:MAG: YfhO family protein [Candidatus Levyibacteriota bacterium]
MKKYFKFFPFVVIILAACVFFYPFLLKAKLPIPSDTIVGLYYPFRDVYSETNPNGLPYKNFLITDPVRQQYPWKQLAVSNVSKYQLPVWNPYEMAGVPLAGNFQSSPFYPLNILLFPGPFPIMWSVFIFIQPILAGFFLYLYLRNLRLDLRAALLGSITWMFCGFNVAWLEWGNVGHTSLWLPLVLLSVDKILQPNSKGNSKFKNQKLTWAFIFISSLSFSLLAGHLQTFFYLLALSLVYVIARGIQIKKLSGFFVFTGLFFVSGMLTIFQWLPTLHFILLSNRASDQSYLQPGWFIPYQNLIQFLAPDFFGNPATLNYFGVWNYAEFIGYAGIISFILAMYAVIFRKDKKTYFFLGLTAASFILATPNTISRIPYMLNLPFVSTAQPTRLMFLIDFSIAVLAALGFDLFLKKQRRIWIPVLFTGIVFLGLWASILGVKWLSVEDFLVAKSNMKLPSILLCLSSAILLGYHFLPGKRIKQMLVVALFVIVFFDLFRFGWKFTPFTDRQYLFPQTSVIDFLQKQNGLFRIASSDSRILPPNFSVMYKLQSIEGYDPLYLTSYARLIAASERSDHSIEAPFGFNRIITPHNFNSPIIDLLNVKYVLSLDNLSNAKFRKVFEAGQTKVYENKNVLPRAFFVKEVLRKENEQEAAAVLFDPQVNLHETAVVEGMDKENVQVNTGGNVEVKNYSDSEIILMVSGPGGFLVVTDAYYPTWKAYVDNNQTDILKTDLAFRGVFVPAGEHVIRFKASLW